MSFEYGSIPVSPKDVSVTSDFWNGRMQTVREASLPEIYRQMKETGRWDSLKLGWKPGAPNKPHQFWDSDVAKWVEAACYSLISYPDTALSRLVEEAVDNIRGAQLEDGYINSYITVVEPEKRWANIAYNHELYCAGHLLEAALAHHMYTGSYRLLEPLLKYVRYIDTVFGLEDGKKKGYPGHEEIELALVRAHEATGDDSILNLAQYFIEERGKQRPEGHYYDIEARARGEPPRPGPGHGPPYSYHQANQPIREIRSIEGHSVRAMYWLSGAAGVSRLTGDKTLFRAVEHLWTSTTRNKMYVTGGLGAMPEWEGFGPNHYLPNESGYLETCAAIALVFFAHQMIQIDPSNVEYANVLELALYNAVLVGVSLDGKSFFYDNPLATVDKYLCRRAWFEVACCPANACRLISSVGGYIYSVSADDRIFVNLYESSKASVILSTGKAITIEQESKGPWRGGTIITLTGTTNLEGVTLSLRIPPGSDNFSVSSDHELKIEEDQPCKRVLISCTRESIIIEVNFTIKLRRVLPHPLNLDNRNCVAIARGPFIYCAESVDNGHIDDLRSIRLPDDAPFQEQELDYSDLRQSGFHEGIKYADRAVFLKTRVYLTTQQDDVVDLILIPYFMWANRGKSDLRVWLPRA